MKARLERTLIGLARRYAPQVIPLDWTQPGDYPRPLPELARALAAHNVLVLIGDIPVPYTSEVSVHIKLWADTYIRLYHIVAQTLFPSLLECNAYYGDQEWPPIIVLHGKATPVIVGLAGYISPFIASRQSGLPTSEVEMRGLADMLLEELEAGDLPRPEYNLLRDEVVQLVKDLLALHVRQMPLTPPKRPILGVAGSAIKPDTPAVPPPVAATPAPPPPERPRERRGPRPPVPDLPDDKRD
jgi:hypothetical protein